MRRVDSSADAATAAAATGQRAWDALQPSVPPLIRDMLHLPRILTPRPRRPAGVDANGRRLPPGPAPPRSWLSRPDRFTSGKLQTVKSFEPRALPEIPLPATGSLMDLVLRRLALDWDFQRSYCHYHIYDLPTHVRLALVVYLGLWSPKGCVSKTDLQVILLPPADLGEAGQEDQCLGDQERQPSPSSVNEGIRHLDLSRSLGRSLKFSQLRNLLFPPAEASDCIDVQDLWDVPLSTPIPRSLLPNLTHLSLALEPGSGPVISWRHFLVFAAHLPTLTHLSLAHWPVPTLTPTAAATSVTIQSPDRRRFPYGGIKPYSHPVDGDWAEAAMVLRRLNRSAYGLEWLDLTGCAAWLPALWADVDVVHDAVDWVGDWGKMATVVVRAGYTLTDDAGVPETEPYCHSRDMGRALERHVRSRRAGRGRVFEVETPETPET